MTSARFQRKNPLEELGPVLDEEISLRHAFEAAGLLGWNVRSKRVFVRDDEPPVQEGLLFQVESRDIKIPNPHSHAILYDPPARYGTPAPKLVSDQYAPIQNEVMLELAEKITEHSACQVRQVLWDTTFNRLLVSIKVGPTFLIGESDPVEFYVIGSTSHDTSHAFRFALRPFRLACGNMLTAALPNVDFSYYAKHTINAPIRISEFEDYLSGIDHIIGGFVDQANEMFFQKMSEFEISTITRTLLEGYFFRKKSNKTDNPSKQQQKEAEKFCNRQLAKVLEILHSPTVTAIRHSAWGGLQAFLEWMQYEMDPPSDKGEAGARILASRAVWPNGEYLTLATLAFKAFGDFIPEAIELHADVVDARIEELDLTVRAFNCLKREGVNTIADLLECTEFELLAFRNFGWKSLDEVLERLAERNLSLKFDPNLLGSTPAEARLPSFNALSLEQLLDSWPSVLLELWEVKSSWAVVNAARPLRLVVDILEIEFFDLNFLEKFKSRTIGGAVFEDLQEAIFTVTGAWLRFRPRLAETAISE